MFAKGNVRGMGTYEEMKQKELVSSITQINGNTRKALDSNVVEVLPRRRRGGVGSVCRANGEAPRYALPPPVIQDVAVATPS